MSFDKLNNETKISILDKMDVETVQELRMYNKKTALLVDRFGERFAKNRPLKKIEFRNDVITWSYYSTSVSVEHVCERLGKREIEMVEIRDEADLDQVVSFFRQSTVTVNSLRFSFVPDTDKYYEILYLIMPKRLLIANDTPIEDFFFLDNLPTTVEHLHIYALGTRLIPFVPRLIPSLKFTIDTCPRAINKVFKRWLRGEQRIKNYLISIENLDETVLFEGIEAIPCQDSKCSHLTLETNDIVLCYTITKANGSTLIGLDPTWRLGHLETQMSIIGHLETQSEIYGYGLKVGVYTNQYYYEQILGTAQSAKPLGLWYFKTNACGKAYDTPDNFGDFVPFDGFKAPSVKQFASCTRQASYAYGVDFSKLVSTQWSCLRSTGYAVAFVRGYNPAGQGSFDANACANIQNAYNAGVGTEVYMTPQPISSKQGYQQLDEMVNGLKNNGIAVRSVWIHVKYNANWGSSTTNSINFINSILSRARQSNLAVGIYTNQYDWQLVTGGWTGAGNDVMLWYCNENGSGVFGETEPDFDDFRPFAGWTQATVKQFAQAESVCGITVNRDVFYASSKKVVKGMGKYEKAESEEIVVGSIGL